MMKPVLGLKRNARQRETRKAKSKEKVKTLDTWSTSKAREEVRRGRVWWSLRGVMKVSRVFSFCPLLNNGWLGLMGQTI
jgi:hypothetical protein